MEFERGSGVLLRRSAHPGRGVRADRCRSGDDRCRALGGGPTGDRRRGRRCRQRPRRSHRGDASSLPVGRAAQGDRAVDKVVRCTATTSRTGRGCACFAASEQPRAAHAERGAGAVPDDPGAGDPTGRRRPLRFAAQPDLGDVARARRRRRPARAAAPATNGYTRRRTAAPRTGRASRRWQSWRPTPTCTSTRRTTCCSRWSSSWKPIGPRRWTMTDGERRAPVRRGRSTCPSHLLEGTRADIVDRDDIEYFRNFDRDAAMDDALGPVF